MDRARSGRSTGVGDRSAACSSRAFSREAVRPANIDYRTERMQISCCRRWVFIKNSWVSAQLAYGRSAHRRRSAEQAIFMESLYGGRDVSLEFLCGFCNVGGCRTPLAASSAGDGPDAMSVGWRQHRLERDFQCWTQSSSWVSSRSSRSRSDTLSSATGFRSERCCSIMCLAGS